MRTKAMILACAVAALPSRALAQEWTGIWAQLAVTSDYRFNGMSSSNRKPTGQVLVHGVLPDGFYAGVQGTGVDFLDGGGFKDTSYEIDLYAGKNVYFGGTGLNLSVGYYTYPNQATSGPDYGFFQTTAEVKRSFRALTASLKGSWSPDYSSGTGTAWNTEAKLVYAVTDWLSATASYGNLSIERGADRRFWSVGPSLKWKDWIFDVRYTGTDLAHAYCYYTDWCEPAVVATLSFGVPVATTAF